MRLSAEQVAQSKAITPLVHAVVGVPDGRRGVLIGRIGSEGVVEFAVTRKPRISVCSMFPLGELGYIVVWPDGTDEDDLRLN